MCIADAAWIATSPTSMFLCWTRGWPLLMRKRHCPKTADVLREKFPHAVDRVSEIIYVLPLDGPQAPGLLALG